MRIKIFISLLILSSCAQQEKQPINAEYNSMDEIQKQHTNSLINETSPYLLQHAHNPVDWHPWGEKALDKAKKENKPLLISIGYSACHWCHVMEHECFEDETVAKVMNDNFICIKIDREERPDIDNIYMSAVHLMGQRGGWPLNCFTTPDGKPFYGGTYFPKENWIQLLNTLSEQYHSDPDKVEEYANKLTEGIVRSDLLPKVDNDNPFNMEVLNTAVERVQKHFDSQEGGTDHAPKFPLPNNYEFLLQYYYHTNDQEILSFVELTLKKMAYGGIYDQIGGGFARYSTDGLWKVPHFEKMLYDNAQLISLYSNAYKLTKNPLYKKIVYETTEFVFNELTSEEGFFYSALDADSEGEEGKFYIWEKEELIKHLGKDYSVIADYYNVNQKGFWENNNYILLRDADDDEIAKRHQITALELSEKVESVKKLLLTIRNQRVRPGLDDKCLTSWNSLMIKGLTDAYMAFNDDYFLTPATNCANLILTHQQDANGRLNHSFKNGRSTIDGFLEDYCFTMDAFIGIYEATLDEAWLFEAKKLMDYSIEHFYNAKNGLFFFTPEGADLIARKMEIADNVIPSSNSCMANVLFKLSKYFYQPEFEKMAHQMLKNVESDIPKYVFSYSNWGISMLNFSNNYYEIAISGEEANKKASTLNSRYIPNKLVVGSKKESILPLLKDKYINEKTMIYVCFNNTCQKPVEKIEAALEQIK